MAQPSSHVHISITRRIPCAAAIVLMIQSSPAIGREPAQKGTPSPPAVSDADTVTGITLPCRQVTLGPVVSGRIARILVAEGQVVTKDTLLATLDDGVQAARTEIARLSAESNVDIELAKARVRAAERELDRVRRLMKSNAASDKELDDAELAVEVRRLEVDKAKLEHDQSIHAYNLEKRRLLEMQVPAPFDGCVTKIIKHVGETVDELEQVLSMVQTDPLEVSIDCPLRLAGHVRVGDAARVRPVDAKWPPRTGKVELASHVGDGASQTFKVKVIVPNQNAGWMSGLKVRVDFVQAQARRPTSQPVALGTTDR
ncbi:MAG: efflux RND transporter periplasmic adaptor subunit [Phycisphaerae bacterium]|nr:efflux RND transporter periplasmic adaptor subunit [Phycisphaerae bacterium]